MTDKGGRGPRGSEQFESEFDALRRRLTAVAQSSRDREEARFSANFKAAELEEKDFKILRQANQGELECGDFNRWKKEILDMEMALAKSRREPLSHTKLTSRGQFMGWLSGALELGSNVETKKQSMDFYRLIKGALPD